MTSPKAEPLTLHAKISYVKSALRIIGYVWMMASGNKWVIIAGAILAGAELLGIIEELPGSYKGTKTE